MFKNNINMILYQTDFVGVLLNGRSDYLLFNY